MPILDTEALRSNFISGFFETIYIFFSSFIIPFLLALVVAIILFMIRFKIIAFVKAFIKNKGYFKTQEIIEVNKNIIENKLPSGTSFKPFVIIDNGIGYFKFYKEGKNILIGGEKTKHFRLLQCLSEPNFGVVKTTEAIFEAIKNSKDDKELSNTDFSRLPNMKLLKIENAKKELQKIDGITGKIKFNLDQQKKKMWLELI